MQLTSNILKNLLTQVKVAKFLGVHIDSSLSFETHVSYMRAIILRQVSMINRVNYFFPPNILVTSLLLFYLAIYLILQIYLGQKLSFNYQ